MSYVPYFLSLGLSGDDIHATIEFVKIIDLWISQQSEDSSQSSNSNQSSSSSQSDEAKSSDCDQDVSEQSKKLKRRASISLHSKDKSNDLSKYRIVLKKKKLLNIAKNSDVDKIFTVLFLYYFNEHNICLDIEKKNINIYLLDIIYKKYRKNDTIKTAGKKLRKKKGIYKLKKITTSKEFPTSSILFRLLICYWVKKKGISLKLLDDKSITINSET